MKCRMIRAAALLLTLCCSCVSRQQPESETDKPIAKVRNDRMIRVTDESNARGGLDTLRFGRMHTGEIVVMQVWVANETTHPIVLTDYARSCGCTSLEFERQPILPGRARRMSVTFDSRGEWGWQLKRVDLHLAGMQRPLQLLVEADVD